MSSTAATSAPEGANQRDSWIPVFSGQPSDYKEWRKRITLYHQKNPKDGSWKTPRGINSQHSWVFDGDNMEVG